MPIKAHAANRVTGDSSTPDWLDASAARSSTPLEGIEIKPYAEDPRRWPQPQRQPATTALFDAELRDRPASDSPTAYRGAKSLSTARAPPHIKLRVATGGDRAEQPDDPHVKDSTARHRAGEGGRRWWLAAGPDRLEAR